jgi:hypothetical protein
VELNLKEQQKYEIIKKLIETNGNKNTAALKLSCTRRHINRIIIGYKSEGKNFFIHGNRGRKPSHALTEEAKASILDFYRTKYYDANFTHYSELLEKREKTTVSTSTVRSILMGNDILSPRVTRVVKKRARLQLEAKKKSAVSKKDLEKIEQNIILLEDAHPRRPRCALFGEMIQMDASVHHWFGTEKTHLHIAVDDSTGSIVGAYFDVQETLKGYYNVFYQILKNHGIPYMFYTDRRTVFEYKNKKSASIETDTFTQFGYACKQLGVEIKTTSIPQAKGRVERIFETLQSRLPIELRLAGATSLAQANIFLASYLQEYNARFALPINNTKSAFEKQPDEAQINQTLAVIAERKVDAGHCIRFENKFFKTVDLNGYPVYYHKGTTALVIKAFDGRKYATINEKVYELDEIPLHEHTSRNFDFNKAFEKPRKRYIPTMSHPWKQGTFSSFVKKERHKYNYSFDEITNSQAVSF